MTAPAHPVVFRPIIRLLREAGHEVEVTARDYAQNIALLRRMGIDHTVVGPGHGGASRLREGGAPARPPRAGRGLPPPPRPAPPAPPRAPPPPPPAPPPRVPPP